MQTETGAAPRRLLVVGGHGITGRSILDAARASEGWTATTASRRIAGENGGDAHIALDLLDLQAVASALGAAPTFDAVAYCAYLPGDDALNVVALGNLLEGFAAAGKVPGRILLIGGGKAYGGHLGPYRTPARESDPRVLGPIFYDQQQDVVEAWAKAHNTSWTILRPDLVAGVSVGSPMNILTSLAAYAAVCRESGLALRFPGSAAGWEHLMQMTDAGILGRASLWALGTDAAAGEIFNVLNGDQFRWKHLWKEVASFFDMAIDEPHPMSLTERMVDKAEVWNRVVVKYGLVPTPWEQIAAWPFVDFVFNIPFDLVQSSIKIRKAGFSECVDTHESVIAQLTRLRAMKLIP